MDPQLLEMMREVIHKGIVEPLIDQFLRTHFEEWMPYWGA